MSAAVDVLEQAAEHHRQLGRGYFSSKFPYGQCVENGCGRAACHRYADNDNGERRVCRKHLPENIIFCPFMGQQEKLFSTECRYVLGGGGAGGTKTYGGARLWLKQYYREEQRIEAGEISRSKGRALFLRRTIPEVLQVIEDFKSYFRRIDPNAKWSEEYNQATFSNGYVVRFGGMQDDDDWQKYWGDYWTLVVFDEATQFKIKQIEKVDLRIRCDDPNIVLQLYLLTNPIGGETRSYLKARFVRVAEPEQVVVIPTKLTDGRIVEDTQVYIPSNVFDNPALMEDGRYEATLRRYGANTLRALLFNDWDVDEGAWVGDDWDPAVHVVEPFPIPKGWTRFKAMDYGHSARTAVHWYAVDPENNIVCYRSVSYTGKVAEEVARLIRGIEMEAGEWDMMTDCSTVFGPADASLWARQGEGVESRGEILDNHGCGFYRGPNRYAGYRSDAANQIRSRLRRRTANAVGELVVPGIRFFSTCKTKVRTKDGRVDETGPIVTIPQVATDEKDPDVWDTDGDDHDLDTLGYACSSRPISGEHELPQDPQQAVVMDMLKWKTQQQPRRAVFPEW